MTELNCCHWRVFVSCAAWSAIMKQKSSGQAKASGSARRSIFESLQGERKADEISACQDEVITRSWVFLWRWTKCPSWSKGSKFRAHTESNCFKVLRKRPLICTCKFESCRSFLNLFSTWLSAWWKYPTVLWTPSGTHTWKHVHAIIRHCLQSCVESLLPKNQLLSAQFSTGKALKICKVDAAVSGLERGPGV